MPFLEELRSLACLASMRPEVTLHAEDHGHWCFDWQRARITVKGSDLVLRPADYCRGLVLHEAAHAAVTRLENVVPADLLQDNTTRHLLNAIEDCRIETWLQERLPGCRPWVRLYNNHIMEDQFSDPQHFVAHHAPLAFTLGIIHRWWYGHSPANMPVAAAAALEAVWPHCLAAIHALPPVAVPDELATSQQYAAHPVASCFVHADFHHAPSPMEMACRMSQHTMWTVLWQHILPVLQQLISETGMELPPMPQSAVIVQASHGNTMGMAASAAARQPSRMAAQARQQIEDALTASSDESYHQARQRLAGLIEPLAEVLLRYLTAETRKRYRRHQPRGQRLDLRMVLQYEADPRLHDRLWMRQLRPHRPDPMFLILVDTSSSMRCGGRAEATFNALVLLREVCLRCGIPLGVIAFDRGSRILQHWSAPDAPDAIARIEKVLRPTGMFTDMCAGLDQARLMLADCPYRHRYLWLLSDGEPNDEEGTRQSLRQIRPELTGLYALGLGDNTQALESLVPGAITGLTAAELPSVVARLFRQEVVSKAMPLAA